VPTPESTCWTVIHAPAAGSAADREELAHRYLGVVRAYLAARWRGSALWSNLDNALQEVFVECFRPLRDYAVLPLVWPSPCRGWGGTPEW
jgi:hypothetical protein